MLDEFPLATHGWDIFLSKRPLVGLDSNIEPTGGRSSWLPPEPGRVPGGSRNDTDFQAENAMTWRFRRADVETASRTHFRLAATDVRPAHLASPTTGGPTGGPDS